MRLYGYKRMCVFFIILLILSLLAGCSNDVTATSNDAMIQNSGEVGDSIDEALTQADSEDESVTDTEEEASKDEDTHTMKDVPNIVGGLPGNIANGSFWGFQGNTMYYTANYDLGVYNLVTGEVYKIKNAAGNSYQVLGDVLYESSLMGIRKVNLVSGEITNLYNDFAECINAVDGWLYYINAKDDDKIYKMDVDGGSRQSLSDLDNVSTLIYYDGQLYFNRDWNSWEIYKMNLDGSNLVMLQQDWIETFIIDNDWIYFSDQGEGIFRFDLNGGNKAKLTDSYSDQINICGGYLFYKNSNDENKFYKLNLTDFSTEKVLDYAISYFSAYEDYLYFHDVSDPEVRLHRMRYDGNQAELFDLPKDIE